MKNKHKILTAKVLLILLGVSMLLLIGAMFTGCQSTTRRLGGTTIFELPEGAAAIMEMGK